MTILLLFFICHFLADFTHLSTDFMLESKMKGFIPGILLHALCHGFLFMIVTLLIYDFTTSQYVFWTQLTFHFLIDLFKYLMGEIDKNFTDNTKRSYWYLFGVDQLLHYIVIIFICDVILKIF